MTTLHLTNAFHADSGGIRTMYLALLQQAEQEQRRCTLVVPGECDDVQRLGRFTAIQHVRAPRSPAFDRRYRLILPHRFFTGGALQRIVAAERPQVIEVCDKYSLCYFAGVLRRRRSRAGFGPTLIGHSCERLDDNMRAFITGHPVGARVARRYLGQAYIGLFDAHIANSQYTADELHRAMQAPHIRPVYVSPPGVHAMRAALPGARMTARRQMVNRLGIPSAAHVLLYAGRLSAEKAVDLLPRVAARLAGQRWPVHLLIAGDGPERTRLE
ncbi:MAG: glycosyltransferase family 4 protein, partial [Acidobacteria bacterium]|nr:glycosyltransferase family 4 protein [Acidobacteriota bacterium]